MALPSEQDIKSHWQGNDILVSICCITYNHQSFIEDAIKGFLLQKTTFAFEIIIHDDASTDSTARIIEEYQNRYPSIIKPILQTTNQRSLGKKSTLNCFAIAKGKYIALCEGDDYWTNSDKLAIQVSAMASYPSSQLCFHTALQVDFKSGATQLVSKHAVKPKVFSLQSMIAGNGDFCPTASMLFEKTVIEDLPDWFNDAPVGDYFYQMFASLKGGAIYLPQVMSVYRVRTPGSWSEQVQNLEKRKLHYSGVHKALDAMNSYTHFEYASLFQAIKASDFLNLARLAISLNRFSEARTLLLLSWESFSGYNLEQRLFYFFRQFDSLLKFCYRSRELLRLLIK